MFYNLFSRVNLVVRLTGKGLIIKNTQIKRTSFVLVILRLSMLYMNSIKIERPGTKRMAVVPFLLISLQF